MLNLKSIFSIGLRKDDRLFSAIHVFKFNKPGIHNFNMVETFLNQAAIALQQKMLQSELRYAKEKAEESERLKTAFLANLSHEIRTPLNIILGYIQMLNSPDLAEERRKQYTDAIHNSSDHLIDIINDILSMAKLDTGQASIQINEFNLNTLVLETYAAFKPTALRKNIRFDCVTPLPDDQCTICSDESKIHQILNNLLNNAFKFTHEGGSVSFGYSVETNILRFFVQDDGIGIPKYYHESIFERFIQVENSSKRKYEGTGLGLPISQGLVKLLGGTIRVESKKKQGTTFCFTVPLSTNHQKPGMKNSVNHWQ